MLPPMMTIGLPLASVVVVATVAESVALAAAEEVALDGSTTTVVPTAEVLLSVPVAEV